MRANITENELRDIIRRRLIIDGELRYSLAQKHVLLEQSGEGVTTAIKALQGNVGMLDGLKAIEKFYSSEESGQIADVELMDSFRKVAEGIGILGGVTALFANPYTGPVLRKAFLWLPWWAKLLSIGSVLGFSAYRYFSIDNATADKVKLIKEQKAVQNNLNELFVQGSLTESTGQKIIKLIMEKEVVAPMTLPNSPGEKVEIGGGAPAEEITIDLNADVKEDGSLSDAKQTEVKEVTDNIAREANDLKVLVATEAEKKKLEQEEVEKFKKGLPDFLDIPYDKLTDEKTFRMDDDQVDGIASKITDILYQIEDDSNNRVKQVFGLLANCPSMDWPRIDHAVAKRFKTMMTTGKGLPGDTLELFGAFDFGEEEGIDGADGEANIFYNANLDKGEGSKPLILFRSSDDMDWFNRFMTAGFSSLYICKMSVAEVDNIISTRDKSFIYEFLTNYAFSASDYDSDEIDSLALEVPGIAKAFDRTVMLPGNYEEVKANWITYTTIGDNEPAQPGDVLFNTDIGGGEGNTLIGTKFIDGIVGANKERDILGIAGRIEATQEEAAKLGLTLKQKIADMLTGDLNFLENVSFLKIGGALLGAAGGAATGYTLTAGSTPAAIIGALLGGFLGYYAEDILALIGIIEDPDKAMKIGEEKPGGRGGEGISDNTSKVKGGSSISKGRRRYRSSVEDMQLTLNAIIESEGIDTSTTRPDGIWGADTDRVWRTVLQNEFSEVFSQESDITSFRDWPNMSRKLNDGQGTDYPEYTDDARGALNIIMDIAANKGITISSGGGRGGGGVNTSAAGTGVNTGPAFTPGSSRNVRRGQSGGARNINLEVQSGNNENDTLESVGLPSGSTKEVAERVSSSIRSEVFTGGQVRLKVNFAIKDHLSYDKGEITSVRLLSLSDGVKSLNYSKLRRSVMDALSSSNSRVDPAKINRKRRGSFDNTKRRKGSFTLVINVGESRN